MVKYSQCASWIALRNEDKRLFDLLISSGLELQMFAIIWEVERITAAFNYAFCVMQPWIEQSKIKIVDQMLNLSSDWSEL